MFNYSMNQPISQQEFDHLFRFIDGLSQDEQERLINQFKSIDFNLLSKQKELLDKPTNKIEDYEPYVDYSYSGNESNRKEGFKRIQNGEAGCLILAGGQGTRLNSSEPKGMYPVSIFKHKTLFQMFAEKVLAASRQAGKDLPLAIMTSPLNEKKIKSFFLENNYFGLNPNQVYFFTQGMLPLLNEKRELFLDSPSSIAMGPNGNGLCLKEFVQSGIWEKWMTLGVSCLTMIPIDNPLADPFDPELIGYHLSRGLDMTSRSIEKGSPDEKVGVFVKQDNLFKVIEYSEISAQDKNARADDGGLKYRCASLSQFCFSMDFIKTVSTKEMPLHLAKKTSNFVNEKGDIEQPKTPNIWKFETFIFDVLNFTNRLGVLLYPRSECFSPLKNGQGDNSLSTVQADLQVRDRQIIEKITKIEQPNISFELAAEFYYPSQDLLSKWYKQTISSGYIEP